MSRYLALICALVLATLTISSACMASDSDWVQFTLRSDRHGGGKIDADFRADRGRTGRTSWSNGFLPSELIGLDTSGFRSPGTRPLRFALIREPGRLDCGGNGGAGYAAGRCRFTPDPRFEQLLISRGIGRPTREQSLGLMALNVRRDLVEAIAAARYPTPTISQLMALTAVGVDGRYIAEMAHAGYRPKSVQALVEFKALGISGDWIGGFVRVGHANIPADQLVQLKAVGVTPDFVAGFDRIGYPNLPVDTLVQLKALGITPEFVRSAVGRRSPMPPVHELVQLKLFGPKGRP